jgi:uncharacterized protein YbjT (DUF2867 family)
MKTALISGATGLVGRHCLRLLVDSDRYESVITIGRRPMEEIAAKHRHAVVDFDSPEYFDDRLRADDIFCTLGTTIKKAGSREAFSRVDRDYPLSLATQAATAGARQFLVVTAQGADPKSFFFYNRVKGDLERDLSLVPLFGVYVFRPTLLLGDRDEKRRGEQFAEKAFTLTAPILRGPLRKWRPVPAEAVARSMLGVASDEPGGFKAFDAEDIRALGRRLE